MLPWMIMSWIQFYSGDKKHDDFRVSKQLSDQMQQCESFKQCFTHCVVRISTQTVIFWTTKTKNN
jgi:hypothetical protein